MDSREKAHEYRVRDNLESMDIDDAISPVELGKVWAHYRMLNLASGRYNKIILKLLAIGGFSVLFYYGEDIRGKVDHLIHPPKAEQPLAKTETPDPAFTLSAIDISKRLVLGINIPPTEINTKNGYLEGIIKKGIIETGALDAAAQRYSNLVIREISSRIDVKNIPARTTITIMKGNCTIVGPDGNTILNFPLKPELFINILSQEKPILPPSRKDS